MIEQDDLKISRLTKVDAVFGRPEIYETANFFKLGKGRPRLYPIWLLPAMVILNDINLSGREAATELSHPVIWNYVREVVAAQGHELPDKPPSRTWFHHTRRRHHTDGIQALLDELLLDMALAGAEEQSFFDDDQPVALYGDAKVQLSRYGTSPNDTRTITAVDEVTGEPVQREVPVRNFDPTAKEHKTGDGRRVHGNKLVGLFIRGRETHDRLPLAVAWVPDVKGEANSEMHVAMELSRRVLARESRIADFIYDGALHGKERDELQRNYGVNTIAPITAKTRNKKTGDRTEKSEHLRPVTFTYGTDDHQDVDIVYVGGWLCQRIVTDDGTLVDQKLRWRGHAKRPNKDGTFRTYVLYELDCPRGILPPMPIREPTTTTDEDRRRGFNRAENVLLTPPDCAEYDLKYGQRSDAETANFQSDEQLHRQRARGLGGPRQQLDMWGHSFIQVCVSVHRHRLRERERQAA